MLVRLLTALLLGPGGEFGFVIVSVATTEHLLAPDTANVVSFVTALTMATIPLLSKLGDRLAPRLTPKASVDPALLIPELIAVRLPSSGLTFGSDRGHHGKARTQTFGSALAILEYDLDRHALRHFCEVARRVVRR